MIFPQIIDLLISHYGWRGAYLALAMLVALTILPVAAALFRDRPEKFGLTPDAGLPPVAADARRGTFVYTQRGAAHGCILAAVRNWFSHQRIGTALFLNHFSILDVTGIDRTRRCSSGAIRGSPGRSHTWHRDIAGPV